VPSRHAGGLQGKDVQTTLARTVRFNGTSLHAGQPVAVSVCPAPAGHGFQFERVDLALPAHRRRVKVDVAGLVESRLCTRLTNDAGVSVATIEHLLAALAGCGIHNAMILVDGPELPILDGSARPFVEAFLDAGLRQLAAPLEAIRVTAPVEVRMGDAWARIEPARQLTIAVEIDFADAAIGRQSKNLVLCNGTFVRELADSRTFCRKAEVDMMRANGLALGGGLHNAVVVDGETVLNPGGLRHSDEPVRHKMLDVMGDLAVAGAPILGRYLGYRSGHTLTGRLLRALLADPDAHERVIVGPEQAHAMPGAGLSTHDLLAPAA